MRYQEATRAAQTFINRTSNGSHTVNPWPEAGLHNDDYYVLTLVPPGPNDHLLTVSKASGKVEWLPAPPSDPDPLGELFPVVEEPEPDPRSMS
ncbi:hypothetical protein [Cumulibacter manganitolerans]|uniref:hypothetical protein n=1 Tax=Cumulibacter manganitolerans TaxID=1884992 RepID=UPI00129818C7|nr:hypothetical protein [Cumulibacter manganitolerans]